MAHLSVVRAVEDRLKDGFTGCPVYVENEVSETPTNATAWALLDFPWSRADWITADEFQEEGGFRVVVAVPRRDGAHRARSWLDEIAALFRGQSFEGVQCYAPQSASSDDQSERGAYFRLSLTVPYEFIITE
ncbi:phage tail terminator-like protein [Aureimonas sp. Leaf324]|uniref:phage tail terminator-like protein n=1 Tax=Aureimonas sp. Leaf324 TaxID=1736336 RepID=UPI0006FAA88A|nr:phage tail terminator-like protein [Aureimonas sp. Leaf324]KQQ81943.1 hypothetical protein ASF65_07765 [Aureimonas sp. Leaf324]